MSQPKHVVVVGGGLVGALNACFFAKRGYHVDLYELREDIRSQAVVKGRSINLALSCRGLEALKAVGLEKEIVESGIPMYGRMIHDLQGNRKPIYYGKKDQYIMSIDRRKLNELLLSAAEKYPNVRMHFQHSLVSCDFDAGRATFNNKDGDKVHMTSDLIVGCDGAFSAVRKQIMKSTHMDYKQQYIPHGYIELCIPKAQDGQFLMEKNYLHIWPRNMFMMIGLPNTQDNTFVITLFMPFSMFEGITTEQELFGFFEKTFPDSLPLMGRDHLKKLFFSRKPLPLITVKCTPYDVAGKGVIMGDAAHAMVPFYGQGMNCGFEDCLVFDDILDKCCEDFAKALPMYTQIRNPDAQAICDLALKNYIEMRSSVNSRMFLARKMLDNILHWIMPNTWIPLYTSTLMMVASSAGIMAVIAASVTMWQLKQDSDSFLSQVFSLDQLASMLKWKNI